MDFSDRNAKLNKRLMESWGYNLNEKKTEKGFGEGTPPEGEWYEKKVVVMEDGSLDHPGMCCADAHSGQDHGAWATAQQQGRTEAPAVVSLEEDGKPWEKDDEPEAEDAAASTPAEEDPEETDPGEMVAEPAEPANVPQERKKRDEPRNYVGRPGHVQNPLHEHEELINSVVERVVARLQKS